MNIYSNLHYKGSSPVLEILNEFPATPAEGQMVVVEGAVYIYTTISTILTWYPLTNTQNHYIHTQGISSTEWTVNHNLGTSNVVFFIYDNNNKLINANFSLVDNNTFTLEFTTAKLGKVVVFATAETFSVNANSENITTNSIINANTSQSVFEFLANGDIMFNGNLKPTVGSSLLLYNYLNISENYTSVANDYLNIFATSEFIITLPSSPDNNDTIFINTGDMVETNNIIVNGNGAEIKLGNNTNNTLVLNTNTTEIKLKNNGSLWEVL